MQAFTGSIALVRHPNQMEKLWLAIWDPRYQHFDFVAAEKLENDSFRECLDRQVAWVLPLRRGKDYLISAVARLHLEALLLVDLRPTAFLVELFIVDLYGKESLPTVSKDRSIRWLSTREVLAGATEDGQPVSPQLVMILTKADVFQPGSN